MATMGSWQPRIVSESGARARPLSPVRAVPSTISTFPMIPDTPSWSLKVPSQSDTLSHTVPTLSSNVAVDSTWKEPKKWNPWSGSEVASVPMSSTWAPSEFDTYGSTSSGKPRRKIEHHMFSLMFFTLCILVFAMPIYVCYKIGIDTDARYWVGQRPLLAVLLLPIYVWVFIMHRLRRTSKAAIIFSLVGSSIWILAITDITLLETYQVILELNSQECSYDRKARLQESWKSAKQFYQTCTTDLSASHGVSMDYAMENYRMEDCHEIQGYVEAFAANPEWTYLEYQESSKQCMGWCERDWQLWSRITAKDSCSQVVGRYLKNYVKWNLVQVALYAALAVVLISGVLTFAAPDIW